MFQQITMLGNVGSDPDVRYTPTGKKVINFSFATSRTFANANGQKETKTLWFRVGLWDPMASRLEDMIHKGSRLLVIGELQEPRVYKASNGEDRVSLEVTAQNIRLVDSRAESEAKQAQSGGGGAGGDLNEEDIPF